MALAGFGALAIVAVLALGWRQQQRSAALLLRGEADLLLEGANRFLRSQPPPFSEAVLDALVEDRRATGLLYAALARPDGQVLATSSEVAPEGLQRALTMRPSESMRSGGRAWVRSRPLPRPPSPRAVASDLPWPPPGAGSLVLCFEPRTVAQVDRAATATALAGLVGAIGLMALGFFARRLLRRLDQERHLASLGAMSAVVAHELRNPLAALKGHAQLLLESLDPLPAEKGQAQQVVDAAWRLERLSNSLLEFARSGALAREDSEPAALVRCALLHFDAQRVRVEDARAPARWSLDPLRFQQMVSNLVENALQAAPTTPVDVRLGRERNCLVLEVRDHGPGVPRAEQERIFEPFFTTRAKGVGLGLAVVRQVVDLHGGTLKVTDAVGGGACFRVQLPPPPDRHSQT